MAAYELLNFPKVFPKNQKPKHPTTGIIAITLAFHICQEVHLAGFRYNFSDPRSPLHYYGNATMSLMSKVTHRPGSSLRCFGLRASLLTVAFLREELLKSGLDRGCRATEGHS